jgi:hypothetical protein
VFCNKTFLVSPEGELNVECILLLLVYILLFLNYIEYFYVINAVSGIQQFGRNGKSTEHYDSIFPRFLLTGMGNSGKLTENTFGCQFIVSPNVVFVGFFND